MTEVANNLTSSSDKINCLMKEAESLKQKLEEERQKLNDVSCEIFLTFLCLRNDWILMKKFVLFLSVALDDETIRQFNSVEHRWSIGDHKLYEYQAETHFERSPGKSFMFELVSR